MVQEIIEIFIVLLMLEKSQNVIKLPSNDRFDDRTKSADLIEHVNYLIHLQKIVK